jgi:hypothetical protein
LAPLFACCHDASSHEFMSHVVLRDAILVSLSYARNLRLVTATALLERVCSSSNRASKSISWRGE